jgi:hypothetical protein
VLEIQPAEDIILLGLSGQSTRSIPTLSSAENPEDEEGSDELNPVELERKPSAELWSSKSSPVQAR